MVLLLLQAIAFADPAPVFVDGGASVTAQGPSWLISESHFDQSLVQAKELQTVYVALDLCTEAATNGLAGCDKNLAIASASLATCHGRMVTDSAELGIAIARVAVLSEQNAELRRQRNRAIGVAVGAVGVSALVVGLSLGG